MRSKSTFLMSRKGIDRPDVRDGGIVKGPHHVRQRIHVAQVADVGAFFEGFLPDRTHVDIFDRGVGQLLGVVERGQAVQAVVGNLGHADVSLTRIGIGLVGKMRLGENSEKRCLAYLGQANNAGFHRDEKMIAARSGQ